MRQRSRLWENDRLNIIIQYLRGFVKWQLQNTLSGPRIKWEKNGNPARHSLSDRVFAFQKG